MKLKFTLALVISIFFLESCKKEEPIEIIAEKIILPETINESMTKTKIGFSGDFTLKGDQRGIRYVGLASEYTWDISYQLQKGYTQNDMVFYPIEKNWNASFRLVEYDIEGYLIDVALDEWKKKLEWTPTEKLYRYDPNGKLALIYESETDLNPKTIMDFNMKIGDSWALMTEQQTKFEVINTFEFTSDNIVYPALELAIINGERENSLTLAPYGTETIIVSPLNPNPMQMMANYSEYAKRNWDLFKVGEQGEPHYWLPNFSENQSFGGGSYAKITWEYDSSVAFKDQELGVHAYCSAKE